MLHDAKVEVTCDGDHCNDALMLEPPVVYGWGDDEGSYDTSDATLNRLVRGEGWTVSNDGSKHYCEDCSDDHE